MMRDLAALGGRCFGGADIEPAIDLYGVVVDDLAVEFRGQMEGQRALTASGGAEDGD